MCQCNLSAMLTAALKKRNPKNTEQYSMKEISVLFLMAIFYGFFSFTPNVTI